jgi:hypothetical protein
MWNNIGQCKIYMSGRLCLWCCAPGMFCIHVCVDVLLFSFSRFLPNFSLFLFVCCEKEQASSSFGFPLFLSEWAHMQLAASRVVRPYPWRLSRMVTCTYACWETQVVCKIFIQLSALASITRFSLGVCTNRYYFPLVITPMLRGVYSFQIRIQVHSLLYIT